MQINNNYSSPSFGVKVSSELPDVLTEKLPARYQYKNAIKDIQNQTEKLSKWGSDFLEITNRKDTATGKDILVLQYKTETETKSSVLKAMDKNKTRTPILSLFLSLTKNDILRAEKKLWPCNNNNFPLQKISKSKPEQSTTFKHIKFE